MRLAYFSPLSPIRSGVSAYSEDLLPHLAKYAEIDLFVDDYEPTNLSVVEQFAVHPRLVYGSRRWAYDAPLYHLGNNLYHKGIYRSCLQYPGIVVLHDYILHGLVGGMTLVLGDRSRYIREMGYCHGLEGSRRGWRIANNQEPSPSHGVPLNRRVLDASLGVVVHSDYARRLILQTAPCARVAKVNMGIPLLATSSQAKARAREELGLSSDCLLVASFGFISREKRVEVLLSAFACLLQDRPEARCMLVGQPLADYGVETLVRSKGLEEHVTLTGYLPYDAYREIMQATDIAVNLRYPTMGETSASVLRLLSLGVPTIVSKVGWFDELPDDCCYKVSPGKGEEEALWRWMRHLASDRQERKEMGERARNYVANNHSLDEAARCYVALILSVLENL